MLRKVRAEPYTLNRKIEFMTIHFLSILTIINRLPITDPINPKRYLIHLADKRCWIIKLELFIDHEM